MNKIVTIEEAISHIHDGATIMVGGFLGTGSPERLIDALVEKGVKDLTLICNDTAFPDKGVGKLIVTKQFKKVIVSHIGTNPETGRQMIAKELDVNLVPQGTLAEQIRSGGAGLGGFLTPTGVGTIVEEGKEKMVINGLEYLLELPLKADVAIIYGETVDKFGNTTYKGAKRNFNPMMATAAEITIVETDHVVEIGEINQNDVMTPGIFVTYIVNGGSN